MILSLTQLYLLYNQYIINRSTAITYSAFHKTIPSFNITLTTIDRITHQERKHIIDLNIGSYILIIVKISSRYNNFVVCYFNKQLNIMSIN